MILGFADALAEIIKQKSIPQHELVDVVETALGLSYRRVFGHQAKIKADLRTDKGIARISFYIQKNVVEQVEDPHTEVGIEDIRSSDAEAQVGDLLEEETDPEAWPSPRVAAQTFKQVLRQRLREIERDKVFAEYGDRLGDVVSGEILRRDERQNVYVNLGTAEALLPRREQIPSERYKFAERMRFVVLDARQSTRTAQVILSRSHPDLVRKLMDLEVPEIKEGVVEIVAVARKPGVRTKVAVRSKDARVDPVGACIGTRGSRASAVVSELRGEKLEIVRYSDDPQEYLASALSPARAQSILLDHEQKRARVVVPDDQLSLAIGRGGHNVRLAARLAGWRVTLCSTSEAAGGGEGITFEPLAEPEPRPEGEESAAYGQPFSGETEEAEDGFPGSPPTE